MKDVEDKFKSGSLLDKADRKLAAELLAGGEVVGLFNRGVCALWFDGSNAAAVEKVWQIKGEGRKSRALALTVKMEHFLKMIDEERLHPDLKNLIRAADFKSKVGSLCFIRAPIKKAHEKALPEHAKNYEEGVCMVQNWDAHGHSAVEEFLGEVAKMGVKYPAVTSMNITGQAEIVNQAEGEQFCKQHQVPIFLNDPNVHPDHLGSYTIFTFGKEGIILDRDGNIPATLLQRIFGLPVEFKGAKKPNYPQLEFPTDLAALTGIKMREAILLFLQKNG